MRVLLFGGSGMLGHDLRATVPDGVTLIAPATAEVDIGDGDAVARAVATHAPAWVVNAAAYTNVDRAETERALAHRVNADGPRNIGRACADSGVRVAHFSTDYVFAGTAGAPYREDDPAGPVNVYGVTKLAGEHALLESGAAALIVRTAWLYGDHGASFPRTMHARAQRHEHTRVVDDQVGRPTCTRDLAVATWGLIARGASGIVHASNSGPATSWYGIARRIFAHLGAAECLEPCATGDRRAAATRPAYSVLGTERLEMLLGRQLPDWRVSLDAFLDRLQSEPAD